MRVSTTLERFTIRNAVEQDVPLVLAFIRELAEYEKLIDEVVVSEDMLRDHLFSDRPAAEVVIGEWDRSPVAFALYFYSFSTFVGRRGIYLEDLYVKPEMRGRGIGRMLLSYLAHLARTHQCGRLEWSVLDWNDPAIRFYRSIGAIALDQWTVQRVDGQALERLAGLFEHA